MRTRIRAVLLVCALIVVAACGTRELAAPQPMSDAEILAIGKEVAACARDNGIPDFPDPYVEKGKLKFPEGAEQAMEQKYSRQVLEQAQQACKPIMDRVPESAIRGDEEVEPEEAAPIDVETMRKLAKCLRENGIPEWPDPKADGSFPVVGTPLEAEGKSPRLLAAGEKCKQYWTGSIRYS